MNMPVASRNTDPVTSHIAERETTTSGVRTSNIIKIIDFVKVKPGHTAGEIANALGMERGEVSKRLADARNLTMLVNGEDRKCQIKASKMMTWYPV